MNLNKFSIRNLCINDQQLRFYVRAKSFREAQGEKKVKKLRHILSNSSDEKRNNKERGKEKKKKNKG